MQQTTLTVLSNEAVTGQIWRMRLFGDVSAVTAPGQFINLRLEGLYLRRPISVCDLQEDSLDILYKIVGAGTAQMSVLPVGARLDALVGLGNGFDPAPAGARPTLIGGGVGVPPLYLLARRLLERGIRPVACLGFNTAEEIILAEEFRALGAEVRLATLDGSAGTKGFVTGILPADSTYFYACGPEPMLKAVCGATQTGGQLSFEARMGCGFGACMGCTCKTLTGNKRICTEGPVLRKEELLWEG